MELEEFKKQLMIEPDSQDQAMLEARRSSVQHMTAAKQSDAFESTLGTAVRLETDPNLVDELLAGVRQQEPGIRRPLQARWLAAAAGLALALGLGSFMYDAMLQATPIREAFITHLGNSHEYPMSLQKTVTRPEAEVRDLFSEFGADMDAGFGKVTYLARCKIGGKLGIHLVLTEQTGDKTTIMFLPDEVLSAELNFAIDEVTARMVSMPTGVVALFGHDGQDLSATTAALLQSMGALGNPALAIL